MFQDIRNMHEMLEQAPMQQLDGDPPHCCIPPLCFHPPFRSWTQGACLRRHTPAQTSLLDLTVVASWWLT